MPNKEVITAHSIAIVESFYDLCCRLYSDWMFHKAFFSENPRKSELEKSVAGKALEHFSILSQESILLQIAKLHDPAIQQGHITLGLEYMVRFGGWQKDTQEKLTKLKKKLDELAIKVRPARHKILSHNDLEVILSRAVLGEFPDGEDAKYFDNLQKFVNVIFMETVGEARSFYEESGRNSKGLLWFFREEACKEQPAII